MQACGGVHGGASPNGQGVGVLGVEVARLQDDGIPDGGRHPRGPEAAVWAVRAASSRGGCRRTLPAGGQKGVSPRSNAYTALLRSCIGSCMISVSRWFLRAYTSSPTWTMSSAMEPVRRAPQRPAGDPSEGTAACAVGAQVVHRARGGPVLVPSLDRGGGADLQTVDPFVDKSGLPGIPGVVPRGIGAVVGLGEWYHGEGP